ncbi:MAG: hypothetical protein K2K97_09065 [Muribaculaceae bacterium]|nr:hypothetical protein [Muribaculaceae bacterium]
MKNELIKLKESGLPNVKPGNAANVAEFFDKVIKEQFQFKDAIKATHKALMQYINKDNAVFALRMFGSDPKRDYKNLRRGFLTIYPNGHKMVFCDNTFSMPFAALKLSGYSYNDEALLDYMNDSSTKCGFGLTKEERELAFYQWTKNKANINLNTQGWYLAHIIPVGKNFSGKNLRDIFDNPSRSEWDTSSDGIRRPENNLSEEELGVLKAHFIRMVHPLNSFLVPKRSLVAYNGKNIGEEASLINFVQDYIKKEFPLEYTELIKIMQIPDSKSSGSDISNILWGESENVIKKARSKYKKSTAAKKTVAVDIDDIDEEEALGNTLKSIGKSVFLKLYPLVKKDSNISIDKVCNVIPEYALFSANSQKTRLSSTKSIVRKGLDYEALNVIAQSSRLREDDRKAALRLLQGFE